MPLPGTATTAPGLTSTANAGAVELSPRSRTYFNATIRSVMMPLKLIWMAAIAIGFGLAFPHPASSEGASKLNITLEQKHVIQELVKDAKIEAADDAKVPSGLSVGDTLPTGLIPVPMPTLIGQKVPHIKAHQLVVSRDMILIVDPKDQQIVATIER